MTRTSVSLAALLLMAACSAAASPSVAAASAPQPAPVVAPPSPHSAPVAPAADRRVATPAGRGLACDVLARPTSNGVLIQAQARADRAFAGEYELVISKSGGGGSSEVTQSGPFSAAAGETVRLDSTELGAGGSYRAVLVLSDASGEVCRQERRS
ncbi:MAG: hypothetical protein JSS00_00480 [Proteobacteria bacterium]|nr:hypothetical protein [Pseudomonadota bacterium]